VLSAQLERFAAGTLALRERLLQWLNDGTRHRMALEGLIAADLAYQPHAALAETFQSRDSESNRGHHDFQAAARIRG
jgi:hypothetical protein